MILDFNTKPETIDYSQLIALKIIILLDKLHNLLKLFA